MQCPHCSSLAADTDRICTYCGRSLGRGLTPAKVGHVTSCVCFVLMIVYLAVYHPLPPQVSFPHMMTSAIFAAGASLVGWVAGWFIGCVIGVFSGRAS
jgi:hypothetical protein